MIYYDVETIVNCFTLCAESDEGEEWTFEISDRRNDMLELITWLDWLMDNQIEMVGFNSLHFDYNVLFYIYTRQDKIRTAWDIYSVAQFIIKTEAHKLKNPLLMPQIDLYKIHHFDNKSRRTSLKAIEFALRLDRIEEMPFPHAVPIAAENIPVLISYNRHDVRATRKFAEASADKIALRRELSAKYSPKFMNYSDSKLGKKIVINELQKAGIQCYDKKGRPLQTHRAGIPVAQILLPEVQFRSRAFNEVKEEYNALVVYETKGSAEFIRNVRGVDFVFALGGIHASVSKQALHSTDTHVIIDADVTSYYPNMSIQHSFYPEHLGERFGPVYYDMYLTRAGYKKNKMAALSEAYKLGLNSVYGDSNSEYSPFYDPKMTMSITINGQLFMAMLCERLMWIKEFEIIQANTDGCTFRIPRAMVGTYREICRQWQKETKLQLEFAIYKGIWVRDVNNYLAVDLRGKVKRKGAYESKPEWHKDHSMLVVAKAAEAHLIRGERIDKFIYEHDDIYDFMMRIKVNKSDRVLWEDQELSGVVRYIVSNDGHEMRKKMPPLGPRGKFKRKNKSIPWSKWQGDVWDPAIHSKNKQVYDDRYSRVNAGQKVTICNRIESLDFDIDYSFYIREARKLTDIFSETAQ